MVKKRKIQWLLQLRKDLGPKVQEEVIAAKYILHSDILIIARLFKKC